MAEFRNAGPVDTGLAPADPPLAVIVPPEPQRVNTKILAMIAIAAVVVIGLLSFGYVERYDANSPSEGQTAVNSAPSTPSVTPNQASSPAQSTAGMATTTGSGSASKPSANTGTPGAPMSIVPQAPEHPAPAPANQGAQAPTPQ